ncbi:alpha/beta fold hydrolase [Mycolicibacterium goodii]|uniref:Alpha/beta hydrolase n=1 Tax=Mycolicibacterium goodii TaxID=134601 RepID=A0A0K0XC54_MYCGD|nr:alpha/beta hydrolase [Mycolicibacterium goodii]
MIRSEVNLPSGRVSYLTWTPEHRIGTVVLLHGGGVDSAELSWGGIGPALASAGYLVICPDHPGYGHSPLSTLPVTQERLVAYVGEFVDAAVDGPYAIGGLSLGGGMTIGHVLERPERVTGAMLLGSYGIMPRLSDGPFSVARQLLTWAMVRTGAVGAVTRWAAHNRTTMDQSIAAIIRNRAHRTEELRQAVYAAAAQPDGFIAFEQWQRDQVGWNRQRTDYTDRLPTFPRPALIVHGGRDTGVPVARAVAAAQLIPHATLKVIAEAGHWVQRDAPDIVLDAMTAFLAAVSATA